MNIDHFPKDRDCVRSGRDIASAFCCAVQSGLPPNEPETTLRNLCLVSMHLTFRRLICDAHCPDYHDNERTTMTRSSHTNIESSRRSLDQSSARQSPQAVGSAIIRCVFNKPKTSPYVYVYVHVYVFRARTSSSSTASLRMPSLRGQGSGSRCFDELIHCRTAAVRRSASSCPVPRAPAERGFPI
jgi:hypothetical protein